MLNFLGFLVALPFVVLALILLALFTPFALIDGVGAVFGLLVVLFVLALVGGVLGAIGSLVAGIFSLVGTILGALFTLLLPLVLVVVAFAFVVALVPLLLPFLLLAGVIWLVARASRPAVQAPPALPRAAA